MIDCEGNQEILEIHGIRPMLSDDFSQNEIDRIVMALKSNNHQKQTVELSKIRHLLVDDFSIKTINRVVMTLKLVTLTQC